MSNGNNSIDERIRDISERTSSDAAEGVKEEVENKVSEVKDGQSEQKEKLDEVKNTQKEHEKKIENVNDNVSALLRGADKDHIYLSDEGVDMEGNNPADRILKNLDKPNTVLHAESGTICVDSWTPTSDGLELYGQGASIIPTERSSVGQQWLYFAANNFVIDGFTFDFTGIDYSPKVVFDAKNWTMRNCTVKGSMGLPETPTENRMTEGRTYSFLFVPTSGTGMVKNCYFPDGAADPDGNGNRYGFISNLDKFNGTLIYDGVYMSGWPNNTIYHQNIEGELIIRNSFFRNTSAGIRCGGGTTISNSTFLRDGRVPGQRWVNPDNPGCTMRGIWTSGADKTYGKTGTIRIEDCDFIMRGGEYNHHGRSAVRADPMPERIEIVDCRIDWEGHDTRSPLKFGYRGDEQRGGTVYVENLQLENRVDEVDAVRVEEPDTITFEKFTGTVKAAGDVSNHQYIVDSVDTGEPDAATVEVPEGMDLPEWVDPWDA